MSHSASRFTWIVKASSKPGHATSLPFLYQTSTICAGRRRAPYPQTSQRRQHDNAATESLQEETPKEQPLKIKYVTSPERASAQRETPVDRRIRPQEWQRALEPSSRAHDRDGAHSGEHFIHLNRRRREFSRAADLSQPDDRFSDSADQDPESSLVVDDAIQDEFEHNEETGARRTRESTITDAERKTFSRLFSDLVRKSDRRGRTPSSNATPSPADHALPPDSAELDALLKAATDEISPLAHAPDSNISSFPQALRDLAADAHAEIAANNAKAAAASRTAAAAAAAADADPAVQRRLRELMRVTQRMLAAPTDLDLWAVLEEELFGQFRLLDLDGKFAARDAKRRGVDAVKRVGSGGGGAISPAKPPAGVDSAAAPAARKPDLRTLAPNYPLHLLTALRLLARRTQPLSPLALHLLPTVHSLGRSSTILGASTPLYNELLGLQQRRGDLAGVVATLRDMDARGVAMDEGTADVMGAVGRAREAALAGRMGAAVRCLEEGVEGRARWGSDIAAWQRKRTEGLRRPSV